MADYNIGEIYQGGYSSLDSDSGSLFTGYRGSVEKLGTATDARSANVLKEFSDKLTPGQKVVELSLGVLNPDTFEAIPKQHLKEINRLSKLTGVEPTVHGPLFDASGVNQNQEFDETNRQVIERKILNVLERSHEINPDGNIPVTFHTANQLPGARYGKIEGKEGVEMMPVVNVDSGKIGIVKRRDFFAPEIKTGEIIKETYDVEKQLRSMNNSDWDNNLQQLIVPKEHADRIIGQTFPMVSQMMQREGKEFKLENLTDEEKKIYLRFRNAQEQLDDIQKHLNSVLDKGYKAYKTEGNTKGMEYMGNAVKDFSNTVKKSGDPRDYSFALQKFMEDLRTAEAPKVYIPAEKYAIDKSVETFGNAAWNAYKKFGEKTPIISIENPPAGMGLSRAKDVKELVEKSREKFVENAKKGGMSESEAMKNAEKLIGATWDVGHINQLRQFGFTGKEIIEEAGKVAPFVKHVHLSDNFGTENVELPMGMGNVDLKEVMEKLGEKGKEARKIVEAYHWWAHHSDQGRNSPIAVSMEALGSPIYSMKMGPYWNQAASLQEGYFSGYGMMLPSTNYEMFGSGFSNLPPELGGQRPGAQGGRMSGRGME
jgi:sugar phosphate isomerase/epimerase